MTSSNPWKRFAASIRSSWPFSELAAPARIEEPEFIPFDLSQVRAEAAAARAASGPGAADAGVEAQRPPATLAELGVPADLARELETAFRVLGRTADGQVVGFRFRSLDGANQPIRIEEAA
jgi:hypothetical protein